jgi:hypothetical protein
MSEDVVVEEVAGETEEVEVFPHIDGLELLPTGKLHVSFSELAEWNGCSWRHKKKHVEHVGEDAPNWGSSFGTAIHAACENFLKTRVMDISIAVKIIEEHWLENGFEEKFRPNEKMRSAADFSECAHDILSEVPAYLDKEFPNWSYIDAEHLIYQKTVKPHAFKGYIDAIIECDGKRGRVKWLIDFKTCGWGWSMEKKQDFIVKSQLIFYKNYWMQETGTPAKDIRCGFVLLKRAAKKNNRCELVAVSVGNVTTERSLKLVNNMIYHVKRGTAVKNRASCKWCPFRATEHCTGSEIAG